MLYDTDKLDILVYNTKGKQTVSITRITRNNQGKEVKEVLFDRVSLKKLKIIDGNVFINGILYKKEHIESIALLFWDNDSKSIKSYLHKYETEYIKLYSYKKAALYLDSIKLNRYLSFYDTERDEDFYARLEMEMMLEKVM